MMRTYSGVMRLDTFEERFRYLQLNSQVGAATFGFERYANQKFYTSTEWRNLRHHIIVRDNGCDLATPDRAIPDRIIIHHLNPVKMELLRQSDDSIFDPENLICVSHMTHNAIHYGDEDLLITVPIERQPGDTIPWK